MIIAKKTGPRPTDGQGQPKVTMRSLAMLVFVAAAACDRGPTPAPAPPNAPTVSAPAASVASAPGSLASAAPEALANAAIVASVRDAITKEAKTSFGALNVSVVAVSGRVTLRGSLASEAEHTRVVAAARSVTGVTSLDDQLSVAK